MGGAQSATSAGHEDGLPPFRQSGVERRISEERLLRARPGANDLRTPRCPYGLYGLFSLSAHAVHEGAAVHLLGREQIVYVTEKADSVHRVHVRSRETLDVIELEPAGLAAPAAVVAHELAAPLGALVHRPLDRVRDVARPRHRLRRSRRRARFPTDGESLLLQVHDQSIERL